MHVYLAHFLQSMDRYAQNVIEVHLRNKSESKKTGMKLFSDKPY